MPYPHDAFLDEMSTQMAISQATRRFSRGSNSNRPLSAVMRVTKPASASASPRTSMMLNRRKTVVGDGSTARRQQQVIDYLSVPYGAEAMQPPRQNARPVSWHPSSHLQLPLDYFQQQPTSYPLSTPNMYADQQDFYSAYPQFSPMLASYSNNTSPSSTFSPLPSAFHGLDTSQYLPVEAWDLSQKQGTFDAGIAADGQTMCEPFPALDSRSDGGEATMNTADWNTFIARGFNNTSPPTPVTFLQNEPVVSETAVPYQPLDEAEEEGEILVGMGLYDTPEKYHEDPQLNTYRSTVSSLLGSTFRPMEPKGKGLKLEETWEPPKSDEEEEEDEDEDEDNDDEDDE